MCRWKTQKTSPLKHPSGTFTKHVAAEATSPSQASMLGARQRLECTSAFPHTRHFHLAPSYDKSDFPDLVTKALVKEEAGRPPKSSCSLIYQNITSCHHRNASFHEGIQPDVKECNLHKIRETIQKMTLLEDGFFLLLHSRMRHLETATLPDKEFLT